MTVADTRRATSVTLVIHGTFAKEESWWRLGTDGPPTFADRLEEALERRGCKGTVWRPALDRGIAYEAFDWEGGNRDRDRVEGARKLRASLTTLAEKVGASEDAPLTVNLVAHSHGGNVVLDALRKPLDNVRIGRVVLLGTPLVTSRPAMRMFRLVASVTMLGLVSTFVLFGLFVLLRLLFPGLVPNGQDVSGQTWLLIAIPFMVVFYGWLFAMLAYTGDVAWRVLCWPFRPPRVLRALFSVWKADRRWDEGAYGPAPRVLRRVLGGRPVVLFTSHDDEADLLLKLGAAPRELYREEVAKRLNVVFRALEGVLIRPIAVGLVLRVLEVVLERVVLGFSWLRVFVLDYELADLGTTHAYPKDTILKRIDVTEELRARDVLKRASGAMAARVLEPEEQASHLSGMARHKETLRETIDEVGEYLKSQVKLRHSLYYQNQAVIDQVAAVLAENAS
jgi:hypothetical protein